jgi:hypothetical protein
MWFITFDNIRKDEFREDVERVDQMQQIESIDSPYAWIMTGMRVVEHYNLGCSHESEHINFISHITAEN